ncbi:hypothetical protein ABVK25_003228 [Lepraria finkii]|uniref:Uncharacterized protein n=1 Tax=Lepraria finkii TaxID=1340010 RepID=A0ABR4BEW5_9LECA
MPIDFPRHEQQCFRYPSDPTPVPKPIIAPQATAPTPQPVISTPHAVTSTPQPVSSTPQVAISSTSSIHSATSTSSTQPARKSTSFSTPSSSTIAASYSASAIVSSTPTTAALASITSMPNTFAAVPFIGQALLAGTCRIAHPAILSFLGGGLLEVPMIGCSEEMPQCCPDVLAQAQDSSSSEVVKDLASATLTQCPSDYGTIASIYWPQGYSLYSSQVLGQTPCYSAAITTIPLSPSTLSTVALAYLSSASSTFTTGPEPTISFSL